MKQTEPGPGYIHFRNDRETAFGEDYFKQLTANEVFTVTRSGREVQEFDAGHRRDEAMDTFVYALAALRRLGEVNFGKIMERMIAAAQETKSPKPQAAQDRRAIRRDSWIGGWRDGGTASGWRGL